MEPDLEGWDLDDPDLACALLVRLDDRYPELLDACGRDGPFMVLMAQRIKAFGYAGVMQPLTPDQLRRVQMFLREFPLAVKLGAG